MKELIQKCKCGIYFEVNSHKDYYDTTEKAIQEINEKNSKPEIDEKLAKEMIEKDTIMSLQFYPHTPVGFYIIYGTDYDEMIKKALEVLKSN